MKNYSRQREEILKVVKENYNHPTAEDVYMIVKAKDPALSRSTVYRNLNLLVDDRIITKIPMKVGADRYDYMRKKHNHAICLKCGKIIDFDYEFEYEILKTRVKEQTGVEILDIGISLEGICSCCKQNENSYNLKSKKK